MKTILSVACCGLFLFSGCGESVNNGTHTVKYYTSSSPKTGHFIDSGVDGLEYERYNHATYTTEAGGSFRYNYGEILTFKIGGLVLGKTVGLSTVTPKDIVSYANQELNTSIYAPEVNNRVRLLMSLDEDGNAANGIQISVTTRTQAASWSTPDFNLSESAFTTALHSATNNQITTVVSKSAAETHFASSLRCVYSGAFRGSWILPNQAKDGFVGVMIQSDGNIMALGDGQDIDGDGVFNEVIYSTGKHNMDTGVYDFNATYNFDVNAGRIVGTNITDINGTGTSQGYNRVRGSFTQDGQTGNYTASRVGSGINTSFRYTGFGYSNSTTAADTPSSDPLLGLFTFDIDRDGKIVGMIHDARTNDEPELSGNIDYNTGLVSIDLKSGLGHTLQGSITFNGLVHLTWYDANHQKLGYIDGIGCQLQTHN